MAKRQPSHSLTVESTQIYIVEITPGMVDESTRGVGDFSMDPEGEIKKTIECSCGRRFRKGSLAIDHLREAKMTE